MSTVKFDNPTPHPAKFTDSILDVIQEVLEAEVDRADHPIRVLDPFAGTGKIHRLHDPGRIHTFGVEIEPEWATQHPQTSTGSALDLAAVFGPRFPFDVVATSCTYGNRMADHHVAKDGSKRMTYTHQLGRPLHPENSGKMHWGDEYRQFHVAAWTEATRVLVPGGLFVLNVKNFPRTRTVKRRKIEEVVDVSQWHLDTLLDMGYSSEVLPIIVPVRGMGFGANGKKRVNHEVVHVLRKGS
jgi:hypothetical protein